MAIKIFEKFAPRANPADGDYPYGSIKNESVPGAKDGTPLDAVWGNDYAGFDAALFAEAGIVPSGNPDTVIDSQRLDAMRKIFSRQFANVDEMISFNSLTIGHVYSTGGTAWEYKGVSVGTIADFDALTPVNARDFGAKGDGLTDDTAAISNANAAALPKKQPVFLPAGDYKVTDTLPFTEGSVYKGVKESQYSAGFGVQPKSTTILFEPSTPKSLFVADGIDHTGFRLHYAVSGMYIKGNSNSAIALDLDGAIYGSFYNLAIDGFDEGIRCSRTISNNFENIMIIGCRVACCAYEGNTETTDIWSECTFFGAPVGNLFRGLSISVRFTGCLYEQLNDGAIINAQARAIMYTDCYSEDVVFDGVSTGAMFKVGLTGTPSTENHLTVVGGSYSGRNAGLAGSFVSADYSNGVIISGATVSRFSNMLKTTVNTRNDSVIMSGVASRAITTQVTDLSKVCGIYPHSNIEDAGAESRIRVPVLIAQELRDDGGTLKVGGTGGALSFFGVAPVTQPSSTGETVGYDAGGGVPATSAATATGGIGSTAYRHSDIVKALKQVGILAV